VRRVADIALAPVIGAWNSSTARHSVALTLDDGPDPQVTPALVDLFGDLDVRATFFLLTLRAERYPHLVERLVATGHEIALHGLDHRRVTEMPGRQAETYLRDARERLENVAGCQVTMFRPPYGSQSIASFRAARRAGLRVVVWNGDAADWEDRSAEQVSRDAAEACRPGGILLFHERLEPDPRNGAPETTFDRVAVLREVIGRTRRRGLAPCRVSDLAARGEMVRTAWLRP
jgi:peptidoglycan/xylan/chitin deacetylase (PgdA/CDA1 family)